MSRLIVLSNRVKKPNDDPKAGGLAVALHEVLKKHSGIWMGWNGDVVENNSANGISNTITFDSNNMYPQNKFGSYEQTGLAGIDAQTHTNINYMTTALTTEQYQHFYCGFSNSVLWPLLHEQPSLVNQTPKDYTVYQDVNLMFAKQLKKVLKPDDVIWVQDYHFMSVAYHCRQLGITNRIGFFLHIPFTSLSFWQQLGTSAQLIKHLAHYDVLGTQTELDKANCVDTFKYYLEDSLIKECAADSLSTHGNQNELSKPHYKKGVPLTVNLEFSNTHALEVNAYPIGVNAEKIQQQVASLFPKLTHYNETVKTPAQKIICVDRIDYSKGLLERFEAYQSFLEQYPRYQHQLELLQIACPSRLDLPVYKQLRDNVRYRVNAVNETFSTKQSDSGWQAISYSERVLNHEALMIAFFHSNVGWVNSLKDGMNLVAKEYIAAQNPDNPGVLVLSCYAGAAEQMQEAVIVDPKQPQSVVNGLEQALQMPLAERKRRYQILFAGLQQNDLYHWQHNFLDDLYQLNSLGAV